MRAVVTVTGVDRRGVIAEVSTFLAAKGVNILDVSQTILGDRFAMVMLVDISEATETLASLAEHSSAFGGQIGMNIRVQHADIFDAMHTV